MTIMEANKILRDYYMITNPTEEDTFLYVEALEYLINETKESRYMVALGGMYYEDRRFDLALKYYEMAAECGNLNAILGLGYIWYYGRTGERNYEKAYFYYNKARGMGDIQGAYKVADMYKNGYFVEKDYEKYKEIIKKLYPKVKNAQWLGDPLPEVFTRYAKICSEDGDKETALILYDEARDFLSQRIRNHPFFGDLTIMKWLINDVYKLTEFDPDNFGLYDLYHVLLTPAKVTFTFEEEPHEIESSLDGDQIAVRFDDKWYRSIDDMFQKAELDGELLTMRYEELYDFEVI
ncbi:MAG: sel1 repeat family protein [Eubacterium sp.]|nr:sel1 repeat family protein [Eubacterium sp.]